MIGNGLAYVSAVVRDPEAVAGILERDFGLRRADCAVGGTGRTAPVLVVGDTAVALFEIGDPFVGGAEKTGVHHLAVSTENVESAAREAQRLQVPSLPNRSEAGLGGSRRILLNPTATGGIITWLSEPIDLPEPVRTTVQRIDHIGVASDNNPNFLEVLSRRLGWPVESTQTDVEISQTSESFTSDKYGVIYRSRQPEFIGGLRVAFVTIGDCELELLQNFDPNAHGEVQRGHAGSTRQDQGVITRYVESRGPGLHHLAFKVRNIDALLRRLHQAGHNMIDTVGRPGSRLAKIGFVHPASLGGLLVHLVEREEIPSG